MLPSKVQQRQQSRGRWQDRNLTLTTWLLIGVCAVIPVIDALRDVQVTVPQAVRRGDNAMLYCHYDMDGENLYSVKWYKGRREFYRYTPKENPAMKVFPVAGVIVKRVASNESQLMLVGLNVASSGKYSCEVSADAPSFHTMIVTGDLEVCASSPYSETGYVNYLHKQSNRMALQDGKMDEKQCLPKDVQARAPAVETGGGKQEQGSPSVHVSQISTGKCSDRVQSSCCCTMAIYPMFKNCVDAICELAGFALDQAHCYGIAAIDIGHLGTHR
ncbi:hypothetical protein quinque_012944 [Culex quinquefasciatus]